MGNRGTAGKGRALLLLMLSSHGDTVYCTLCESLCMCVVYECVCSVLTHVYQPDVNIGWLPLSLTTLFFEIESLTNPEACNFG